jgi:hypothetical protein
MTDAGGIRFDGGLIDHNGKKMGGGGSQVNSFF